MSTASRVSGRSLCNEREREAVGREREEPIDVVADKLNRLEVPGAIHLCPEVSGEIGVAVG